MKKNVLSRILVLVMVSLVSASVMAQGTKAEPEIDKSPLDVSYFPVNYPMLKLQDKATEPLKARVLYSRPQVGNRKIFGNLVEYDHVWRLGANEATELEFFTNASINGTKIKKGRYTLFAVPDSANWTFILSRDTDSWGSFRYSDSKDVVRMKVPVQQRTDSPGILYPLL